MPRTRPDVAERLAAPTDDLEHERILAAVSHGLFGRPFLRIGPYRVIRMLGAGGMGEVFLAQDETLDRKVAIKVLGAHFGGPSQASALQAEGRALARLSHPNVVQIHEFGEHAGRAYVAMEHVDGPTLRQWLDAVPRSYNEILDVFRSAGAGLAAAHAVGVVHRDFKPDNVLIGADERVRVVDFGLAIVEQDAAVQAGTPSYMAPEQRTGTRVDARSDQYSFCVALYEALWGKLPPRQLAKHRVPHSRWVWRRLRRGLDPDPERRWSDLDRLLEALDPRPRRRRLGLAGGGVLAMTALTAWWATPERDRCEVSARALETTWGSDPAETLRRSLAGVDAEAGPAEAQRLWARFEGWSSAWRESREQVCRGRRAEEISEVVALRREACLEDQRRWMAAMTAELARADRQALIRADELAHEVPDPAHCESREVLQTSIAPPRRDQEDEVDDIRQLLREAKAQRLTGKSGANLITLPPARDRVVALDYPPLLAEYDAELAFNELVAGSAIRGRKLLAQAAREAYRIGDDRLAALAWVELSWHEANAFHELAEARRYLEHAHDAWVRVGEPENGVVPLAYATGALAIQRGDYEEAERELAAAMTALNETSASQRWRPFVLGHQALLAQKTGDLAKSLGLSAQARDASERLLGPTSPRTIHLGIIYAVTAYNAEDPELARQELDLALARWKAIGSPRHRWLAEAHQLQATLAKDDGDPERAIAEARQAVKILIETVPKDHRAIAIAHYNLGVLAYTAESYEVAAASFAEATELFGKGDTLAAKAAVYRGRSLLEQGELEPTRAGFDALLESNDPEVATLARLGLAEIELRSGQPEAAQAQLAPLERGQVSELELAHELDLLAAVITLRTGGRQPSHDAFASVLDEASEDERNDLQHLALRLDLSDRERTTLGLATITAPVP